MVPLIVILTIIIFVLVDLFLRLALKKREEAKLRKERQEALDIGLKLEFAEEAASLKRVEVPEPKARLLAVDDEPVILDSFRRILVLEGFSVDTVETGPEALALVRQHDYDFLFTDLKMPGMDGLDVTKAVKHLRPDIDVVMITGYATIESAVDAMKYGAMDYVQKPFSADELAEFARKLLIRREARLEDQTPPTVHLVTAGSGEEESPRVINVPGGVYVSPQHLWVGVDITGEAKVGVDDLVRKTLVEIDEIHFPEKGQRVAKGEELFRIKRAGKSLSFPSPLTGRVSKVNHEMAYQLELLDLRPFATGWICTLVPERLTSELTELQIGADSVEWYEGEIGKFSKCLSEKAGEAEWPAERELSEKELEEAHLEREWQAFEKCFLQGAGR
jgi:CheY-like chemotaxis protein